jgi:uncharacterized protein
MWKIILLALCAISVLYIIFSSKKQQPAMQNTLQTISTTPTVTQKHILDVLEMSNFIYTPSPITITETRAGTASYNEYIASYVSRGNIIYALLTVPKGKAPEKGFPVIMFNHGFIPPNEYRTTERYGYYVDYFARNGYIVFKSDYRGHGNSGGEAIGPYFSSGYHEDVMQAIESITTLPQANAEKIGIWGHSLGGNIAQRIIVTKPSSIKAVVIWAGVIGNYETIFDKFFSRRATEGSDEQRADWRKRREGIIQTLGTPTTNPSFWNSIDPAQFYSRVQVPVQIHHGDSDETVPKELSLNAFSALKALGKDVEYYEYPNGNHNLSGSAFTIGMQRALVFFDKHLKN